MVEIQDGSIPDKFVSKEGERSLMVTNTKLLRYPSLEYKYTVGSEDKVDKAFDILFEEVMKLK